MTKAETPEKGHGRLRGVTAYPHPSNSGVTTRMRSNRSQDTGPELRLRSALHRMGLRYRANPRLVVDSGRPIQIDIAFTKVRVAVFVDGCFWHGCSEHRSVPVANREYWEPKIARNIQRDKETIARLERAGWKVLRVWEHEDVGVARDRIKSEVQRLRENAGGGNQLEADR
jgi:DNA mismatch endonuclease, patch repair protein